MSTPMNPASLPLIGVCGLPYAGKDSIIQYLATQYQVMQCAFGDPIKLATMQIYGLSLAQVTTGLKDRVDPRWRKTPRELLQHTGATARQAAPHVWVHALMTTVVHPMLAAGLAVGISDVREPIEAEAIRAAGGIIWRVIRPDAKTIAQRLGMPTSSGNNPLEQGLEGIPVQATLVNDGTLDDLHRQIDLLVHQLSQHSSHAA